MTTDHLEVSYASSYIVPSYAGFKYFIVGFAVEARFYFIFGAQLITYF